MDYGHYNCRDYYITPPSATITKATTITTAATTTSSTPRNPLWRHESWQEMEQRCRSPASTRPKFPLLRLPLELRQEIFSYILPRTKELLDSNPLTSHALNFSAVQKRQAKGMILPRTQAPSSVAADNVVWQRGRIDLFCVCRQLHDECAEMLYGSNTFLLFVAFDKITFRFRWVLPSGLAPTRSPPFLELLPGRYVRMIKKVTMHIDHVDPYTGMIKFNVSGKGLTHGLRRQVQMLVNALKGPEGTRLTRVNVRVSNANVVAPSRAGQGKGWSPHRDKAAVDSEKWVAVRQREDGNRVAQDVDKMLAPLRQLYGVHEVSVSGAVTEDFARGLQNSMKSTEPPADVGDGNVDDGGLGAPAPGVCVYGNDMT